MDSALIAHMVIEGFLVSLIVFIVITTYNERKNLLDRIMSRDFPEFVNYENERKKVHIPEKIQRDKGIHL